MAPLHDPTPTRTPDRRRRHRRLGEVHPALAPRDLLVSEGFDASFTEWNSSPLVKDTRSGARRRTSSRDHLLADPCDGFRRPARASILPPLRAASSCWPTAGLHRLRPRRGAGQRSRLAAQPLRVRDAARPLPLLPRDLDTAWRASPGAHRLKYHEAGMDLGLSQDPITSFRLFQARCSPSTTRSRPSSA